MSYFYAFKNRIDFAGFGLSEVRKSDIVIAVNIAGEGKCTFSRILEIVLFFFAVRQKADRAAGRGRGCFFAARVVG